MTCPICGHRPHPGFACNVPDGPDSLCECPFDDRREPEQPMLDFHAGRTRNPDHATSVEGAKAVEYRAGSQKAKLLRAYELAATSGTHLTGLTDEEAARVVGLMGSCYWKRCNELRQDGKIVPTGEVRRGTAGVNRIVCRVKEEA